MTNPLLADPTRTGFIRQAFIKEIAKRFSLLKQEVDKLIVTDDAFGLVPNKSSILSYSTNEMVENYPGQPRDSHGRFGSGMSPRPSSKQTSSPKFKKWFGDSKVVDDDGKPLVVYHATGNDFKEFKISKYRGASFFSTSSEHAVEGARAGTNQGTGSGATSVIPVYLSVKNLYGRSYHLPKTVPDLVGKKIGYGDESAANKVEQLAISKIKETKFSEDFSVNKLAQEIAEKEWKLHHSWTEGSETQGHTLIQHKKAVEVLSGGIKETGDRPVPWEVFEKGKSYSDHSGDFHKALKALGYDGALIADEGSIKGHNTIAVFHPTQIKSAIGNKGTFDPSDPIITHQEIACFSSGKSLISTRDSNTVVNLDRPSSYLERRIERVIPSSILSGVTTSNSYSPLEKRDEHGRWTQAKTPTPKKSTGSVDEWRSKGGSGVTASGRLHKPKYTVGQHEDIYRIKLTDEQAHSLLDHIAKHFGIHRPKLILEANPISTHKYGDPNGAVDFHRTEFHLYTHRQQNQIYTIAHEMAHIALGFADDMQDRDDSMQGHGKYHHSLTHEIYDWAIDKGLKQSGVPPYTGPFKYPKKSPSHLTTNTRFSFHTDEQKLQAFRQWLGTQVKKYVATGDENKWWDKYIADAYKKGQGRAFDEVDKKRPKDLGKPLDFYNESREQFLRSSFGQPETKEKIKLLAARTFNELQGVTDYMSQVLTRTLMDGVAQGKNPKDIAKDINKNIDSIGLARANTIARTEVARAHNESTLDSLEALGVDSLNVMVEWRTTYPHLVTPKAKKSIRGRRNKAGKPYMVPCKICAPLNGVVLTIAQARGMFPRHPNCFVNPQVPIYTSKGWKKIVQIRVGDLVLTHKGRFRKVKELHRDRSSCANTVKFTVSWAGKPYKTLEVTEDHLIRVNGYWVPAKYLREGDYVDGMSETCGGCGAIVPFGRKYCDQVCMGTSAIEKEKRKQSALKQWENEEFKQYMSEVTTERNNRLYASGQMNGKEITKAAHAKVRQLIAEGKFNHERPSGEANGAKQPEARRKISESKMGDKNPMRMYPELAKVVGETMKQFFKENPEKHPNHKMAKKVRNGDESGKTDIEFLMGRALSRQQLKPVYNHYSGGLWIDYAFPEQMVAVECDGEYWHQDKEKEDIRDKKLQDLGWTVLHFTCKEIKENPNDCARQVLRILKNHNGEYEFEGFEITHILKSSLYNQKTYNFSVEEDESYIAKGLVVHNCLCCPVPANLGESTEGQKRTPAKIRKAINLSLRREAPEGVSLAEQRKESSWVGGDLSVTKGNYPNPLFNEYIDEGQVSEIATNYPGQPRDSQGRFGTGGDPGQPRDSRGRFGSGNLSRVYAKLKNIVEKGSNTATLAPTPAKLESKQSYPSLVHHTDDRKAPSGITFSGTPTPFTHAVWDKIEDIRRGYLAKDHKALRELGEIIHKEIHSHPAYVETSNKVTTLSKAKDVAFDNLDKAKDKTDYDRLDKIYQATKERFTKHIQGIESQQLEEKITIQVMKKIRDFGTNETIVHSGDKTVAKLAQDAAQKLPTDWMTKVATIKIQATSNAGDAAGSFSPFGKNPVLAMSLKGAKESDIRATAVHELGHATEHVIPTLGIIEREYLESRMRPGEKPEKSEATLGGEKVEIMKDKFIRKYSGRLYNGVQADGTPNYWPHFEIISTGVEAVLGGHRRSIDDDHAKFIYGILAMATPY